MFDDDPTIAAFARDLQDAAAASPAPAIGASLAAVLDGRAPAAVYPEVVSPGRVRPSRRSLRLRWAVAGTAFGIGASSLGIAGALPGPVQRQVSRMADVIGVDLPDGRPTTTTTVTPHPSVVPPSTVPRRPVVVPADELPVAPPTTVEDGDRTDDQGRDDSRGRDDDLDDESSDRSVQDDDDELESRGPGHGIDDDRGPVSEVTDDEDHSGSGDEDDGADDGAEDRSGLGRGAEDDSAEDLEP